MQITRKPDLKHTNIRSPLYEETVDINNGIRSRIRGLFAYHNLTHNEIANVLHLRRESISGKLNIAVSPFTLAQVLLLQQYIEPNLSLNYLVLGDESKKYVCKNERYSKAICDALTSRKGILARHHTSPGHPLWPVTKRINDEMRFRLRGYLQASGLTFNHLAEIWRFNESSVVQKVYTNKQPFTAAQIVILKNHLMPDIDINWLMTGNIPDLDIAQLMQRSVFFELEYWANLGKSKRLLNRNAQNNFNTKRVII